MFRILTFWDTYFLETGRKLDVEKMFRKRPGSLLEVLCSAVKSKGLHKQPEIFSVYCGNMTVSILNN